MPADPRFEQLKDDYYEEWWDEFGYDVNYQITRSHETLVREQLDGRLREVLKKVWLAGFEYGRSEPITK
jgi:hypothetical protein